MSAFANFPDAIVFLDGTVRLITRAAKNLAYANTNVGKLFSISTADAIPDYVAFDDSIPEMLEDEGLIVWQEHVPVGYYRSMRRRWPKSTTYGDGEVIRFMEKIPEFYRQAAQTRAYARHRQWRHEAEKKRARKEKLQDEQPHH